MTATQLIEMLKKQVEKNGDLKVVCLDTDTGLYTEVELCEHFHAGKVGYTDLYGKRFGEKTILLY